MRPVLARANMRPGPCIAAALLLATAHASCAQAPGTVSSAQPLTDHDPLTGIWASEIRYGPVLQGELVLTRQDDAWRATISDAETAFQPDGEAIRVAFPRGLGKFRGTMTGERDPIAGFWLQPGVTVERPDPVGSRQAFAAPLVLQRSIVVPELDLAVVFTGGNYRQGSIWLRWRGDIVGDAVIAAIR